MKGPLWPSHRLVALGRSEGIDATAHAINLDAAGIAAKALVRSSPDDRLASPTQLHLIIAKAHALAGNRVEACAALQDASRAYAQERRSDLTPIDRRSKNITENLAGERERLGCG